MSRINYSKCYEIQKKVITKKDIDVLVKALKKQFSVDDCIGDVTIAFQDGSSISGDDIDIFEDDSFERRISKKIYIRFKTNDYFNKIRITLYNSAICDYPSIVEIESTDKQWYESAITCVDTIINEIKPQKNIKDYFEFLIANISTIIETVFFVLILDNFGLFQKLSEVSTIMLTMSFYVAMAGLNFKLVSHIKSLYPNIEFDFGPDFCNKTKKFRKKYAIGLPFVIDLILFILSFIFS